MVLPRARRANIGLAIISFAVLVTCAYLPAAADTTGIPDTALASWRDQFVMQQVNVPGPRYSTSSLLVRVSPDQSTQQLAKMLQQQTGVRVRTYERFPQHLSVTAPAQVPLEAVQQYLEQMPQVQSARPHLLLHQLGTPNDPFFVADPETMPNQYYLYDINALGAWSLQPSGSPDVKIAIIDSGISVFHEDLAANIVPGYDFVGANVGYYDDDPASEDSNPTVWDPAWGQPQDKDPPFYPFDFDDEDTWLPILNPEATAQWWEDHYDPAIGDIADNVGDGAIDSGVTHGTLVAGIAGAVTNNNTGYAGISWNCSIMPVRIINAEGWGFGIDAADAIIYAADNGADVINCSWGFGPMYSIDPAEFEEGGEGWLVQNAIEYAYNKGCIIVCAAGNAAGYPEYAGDPAYWDKGGGLDFPASMPETISVAALDWEGERAAYSSVANPDLGEVLDISAPGDMAWSTGLLDAYMWWMAPLFYDTELLLGEDTYEMTVGGTSFTAPLVSGFAALLRARYGDITPEMVREALQRTAVDLNESTYPGYDIYLGYGRLDAYEAILMADQIIPEPTTISLLLIGLAGLAGYRRLRRQ